MIEVIERSAVSASENMIIGTKGTRLMEWVREYDEWRSETKEIEGVQGGETARNVWRETCLADKWETCTLRFPSFLPHRFLGGVFVCFIRFWASRALPGRGPKMVPLGVALGGHFGVDLGSILDLIWGLILGSFLRLMFAPQIQKYSITANYVSLTHRFGQFAYVSFVLFVLLYVFACALICLMNDDSFIIVYYYNC